MGSQVTVAVCVRYPPRCIIWMLLWHPPEMDQTGTIIWLFCTAVLARTLGVDVRGPVHCARPGNHSRL